MWKPFATDHSAYLIKCRNDHDRIELLLSDLKSLWIGNFSKESLSEMFKDVNPSVEIEDISSQVLQILDRIDNTETNIVDISGALEMRVSYYYLSHDTEYKVPLKLKFNLELSEDEKFEELVTIPMVQTITFLETQQKVLCSIIRKKDRELEEYKLEKGVVSRSDLITEPFNLNVLNTSSDKLFLNTFQQSERFTNCISKFQEEEVSVTISLPESLKEKNVKRKRRVYRGGKVMKYTSLRGEETNTKHIKTEQQIKAEKE